jgi:hypothetical protein
MPAQPLAMELLTYLFIIHSKSATYSQSLQVSKLPLNQDMTKRELNHMGPPLKVQIEFQSTTDRYLFSSQKRKFLRQRPIEIDCGPPSAFWPI